jgi:ribosomal protein S18 acetylase RimI-like enzyme
MLDLLVSDERFQPQAEQALLEQLDRELRRRADRVRIVVPETKLRAQLFLREAGYRATRVFHEHFGNEDGYLMESQGSGCATETSPRLRAEPSARAAIGTN